MSKDKKNTPIPIEDAMKPFESNEPFFKTKGVFPYPKENKAKGGSIMARGNKLAIMKPTKMY